jgi:hypothetical protein
MRLKFRASSAGDRLGPCEILSPIGKSGMGEVYKARDTKLDCGLRPAVAFGHSENIESLIVVVAAMAVRISPGLGK